MFLKAGSPSGGLTLIAQFHTKCEMNELLYKEERFNGGGFFDVPGTQKRLGELNALMAADNFWNNREQAQKLIEESNSLRERIEPLMKAEKQLEDFHVMVELGESEPETAQAQIEKELER